MERFIKGEVVVVSFPFSDLSSSKKRPALVLSDLKGKDIILCQITSQNFQDNYSVKLNESDFEHGKLHKSSNIRPNKIFTADKSIILRKVGKINLTKFSLVSNKICELISIP